MEEIKDFFAQTGVKISALIGGLAGAMVALMVDKREMSWKRSIAILISGTLSAAFLTSFVAYYAKLSDELTNGLSFLIGLTGMKGANLTLDLIEQIKENPSLLIDILFRRKK